MRYLLLFIDLTMSNSFCGTDAMQHVTKWGVKRKVLRHVKDTCCRCTEYQKFRFGHRLPLILYPG